ncbi:hypothetical protein RJ640_017687 [Escallonia rubra]|uniref:Uncharacterized protein n=1 Tax=Escallonia rubra TaxID=112253 RepID=A0AA88U4D5_9ASTE|nr:hypothetical protein RJ640_017687 [Escallonia rubra]
MVGQEAKLGVKFLLEKARLKDRIHIEGVSKRSSIGFRPKVVKAIIAAITPFYSLESKLGDYYRADAIKTEALERITSKSLNWLGFNYDSIWGSAGRCLLIPMGIAEPLFLDDREYYVPMATIDGCLVASTNSGCKAILLKDGITRASIPS